MRRPQPSRVRARARTTLAGLALVATVTSLVACAPPAASGPSSLTIGVDPSYFNAPNPLEGMSLIFLGGQPSYEALLGWDTAEQTFVPWLAQAYEISDERLSMTMKLREDVDFSDGTHFDAESVIDFLEVARELQITGLFDQYGLQVATTDEYTLELTTTKVIDFNFLFSIQGLPIVSPTAVENSVDLVAVSAGTGPYIRQDIVADVSASYVRNPEYWNPDAYDFDELELKVFVDEVAALNALKAGQVDVVALSAALAGEAEAQGYAVHTLAGSYATLVVLDYTGAIQPALADVRVRQAMNMAFDHAAILAELELGYGRVSSQPFSLEQAEYVEGGDTRYAFDLDRARELMAEAGYADGFDIVIPTMPASAFYPARYEPIVQQSLGDIGIRVEYVTAGPDLSAIVEAWMSGTYPVILATPAYLNTVDVLKEPSLFGRFYDDDRFAQLVALIDGGSIDEAERAAADLGEYILDEAWYVPIAHLSTNWVSDPDIHVEANLNSIRDDVQLRSFGLAD